MWGFRVLYRYPLCDALFCGDGAGVFGQTLLHRLLMGKISLDEWGSSWLPSNPPPPFHNPNCLKYILVQCLGSGLSRDYVVGIATTPWNGRTGVWIPVGARNFVFSKKSRLTPGLTQFLAQWTPSFFTVCKATTHFHLMSRLRMSGAIPLPPSPPVCFYSMDRDNFTFR